MSFLHYHDTGQPDGFEDVAFGDHLDWLAERKRLLSLQEALARTEVVTWRPAPGTATLLFDEGLPNLSEVVLPAVLRRRVPAVLLVGVGQVADGTGGPARLDAEDLRWLEGEGIAVVGKGWSGRDLTSMGEDACRADLRRGREALSDLLRRPVRLLAYPEGRHCLEVRRAADEADYEFAFGDPQRGDPPCPLGIPWIAVQPEMATGLLRVVTSRAYLPWSSMFPELAARVVSVSGGGRLLGGERGE